MEELEIPPFEEVRGFTPAGGLPAEVPAAQAYFCDPPLDAAAVQARLS